jgi:hypothetical protein
MHDEQRSLHELRDDFNLVLDENHDYAGIYADIYVNIKHRMGIPEEDTIEGTIVLGTEIPRHRYVDDRNGMPQKRDVTLELRDGREIDLDDLLFTSPANYVGDHNGWEYGFVALGHESRVPDS